MRRSVRLAGASTILVLAGVTPVVHGAFDGLDDAAAVESHADRVDPPELAPRPHGVWGAMLVADLVNDERSRVGLPPLRWHGRVATAAAAQATDMAAAGVLRHAGSDGSSAGDRLQRAGFAWRWWGETIGAGSPTAEAIVGAWMASDSHRAQLLGDFSFVGVGAAAAADGTPYWALVVAR